MEGAAGLHPKGVVRAIGGFCMTLNGGLPKIRRTFGRIPIIGALLCWGM